MMTKISTESLKKTKRLFASAVSAAIVMAGLRAKPIASIITEEDSVAAVAVVPHLPRVLAPVVIAVPLLAAQAMALVLVAATALVVAPVVATVAAVAAEMVAVAATVAPGSIMALAAPQIIILTLYMKPPITQAFQTVHNQIAANQQEVQ